MSRQKRESRGESIVKRQQRVRYGLWFLVLVIGTTGSGTLRAEGHTVVHFPDPEIEFEVRSSIQKSTGDIYDTDLVTLTQLWVYGYTDLIRDLSGLEYCVNLRELGLMNHSIDDLSPLAGLSNLEILTLLYGGIGDLSPLAGLSNLRKLLIGDSWWDSITNLSALAELPNLTELTLVSDAITDISALAGLRELEVLDLKGNLISDLSPLAGLSNLNSLDLCGNGITDLTPLGGLATLERLILCYNAISDCAGLAQCAHLTYLDLSSNQITDINSLSGLTSLVELRLSDNQIGDVSPLLANPGLGNGDLVTLRSNPLNCESVNDYIPALEAGGVLVSYNYHVCLTPTPTPGVVGDLICGSGCGAPSSMGNVVRILLENPDTPIRAVQFILRDVLDRLTCTEVTTVGRASDFHVAFSDKGEGGLTILCFSLSGAAIPPGDTETIMEVRYRVSTGTEYGTVALNIADIQVGLPSPAFLTPVHGEFAIGNKADLDRDYDCDIFDMLRLVDVALGSAPSPSSYEFWAGDLDTDGDCDLFDVLILVDDILETE